MASATATATMSAAAGMDKRASSASSTSSLQTPGSGGFPSEMLSPMSGSPGLLKKDDLKTPITPPSAYLDFLKSMSPNLASPLPTGMSSRFSFNDKTSDKASEKPSHSPPTSQPASQPSLSRNTSYESNASATTTSTDPSASSRRSSMSTTRQRPESPRVIIPPSTFVKPAPRSATSTSRTPRRLTIPHSPFSPQLSSAKSIPSPYISTPLSSTPWSASFSPRDRDHESSGNGKVSVRQVVTRTVTYCRTPLDPAPKGKRRKIDTEEDHSKPSFIEPAIKREQSEGATTTSTTTTTSTVTNTPFQSPPAET